VKKQICPDHYCKSMREMNKSTLVNSLKKIVDQRGKEALDITRIDLRSSFPGDDNISAALRHFGETTLKGVLPVFPALISLSCEAVGGETEKTRAIGSAVILIAGGADIHDDVIDESPLKGSRHTVYGKFGKDIAVLAGDVLLTRGLLKLQKECESIPIEQRERILSLLAMSVFDISRAEALEARMRAELDFSPETYLDIIDLKSVVPELNMKIGAILGNGDKETVETLGHFGRTFGNVSTIAEEFMDMLEHQELKNRLRNKCLPLPYLLALRDSSVGTKISPSKVLSLSRTKLDEIKRNVLSSSEVDRLRKKMSKLVHIELKKLDIELENSRATEELRTILESSLQMLLSITS
jgi:geranylgeranyl pyrophosphate synthase